tara:strand:- start:219 stop:662 length:444 start_codon:yes stop_codon:yes gene_type:complete
MPLKGLGNVKKMIRKNKKDTNIKLYAAFYEGLSETVKETPVDEGRLRNNWWMTEGTPFALSSSRGDNTSGSGSLSSLSSMPTNVLNKKLYFTNNMPYILPQEYGGYPNPSKGDKTTGGYSKQLTPFRSPKGWVRFNLIRIANKVREL